MPPNNILAASILFIKGGASAGFKICNSGLSNSKSAVLSFAYPCTRSMTYSYMQRCKRSSKTMHILSASVSSLSDASADSKARAPFSAPKSAFDDSITSDPNLLNDESWGSLGLTTDMVKALKEMELTDPTPVQRMAIPTIMGGKTKANVSFAAATGSGKTLAYLLPIMQALKAEEELHANALKASDDHHSMKPLRRPKRARAIILTPTRELSRQILSVIKQVSHHCKLSSVGVIGGEDYGKQRKALDRPVDIVVASPGRLLKHRDAGHVYLGSVSHVVIDEVDTMLEQGFQGDVAKIIHPMLYKNNGAGNLVDTAPQLIMTSATITPAVRRLLNGEVKQVQNKKQPGQTLVLPPNLKMLEAPGLHRAVPRLRQVFVDVGSSDKLSLLIDVLSGGGSGAALQTRDRLHDSEQSQALTIVFCNTVASARAAEHALAEAGLMTLSYHGDLGSTDRAENLNKFRSPTDASNILVATDIAARGVSNIFI